MRKSFSLPVTAFLLTALVALSFALYTNHTWEDYYITYRTSKNLATGQGLVFNVGDRLHTFTSPLGVILPAVSYLLTFNSSDAGALWIFRLMSCAALGGAAALLGSIAVRRQYALGAGVFMVAALATDSKTVDFSINGMETAFLLLFLAYTLWAHLCAGPRQWLHLGAAWAGLMWSRPDSFIYIGLIAAGFWLFNDEAQSGCKRRDLLGLFVRAGAVTTALYLPWLLFSWGYYGTPIPHTITAKSGLGEAHSIAGLLKTALNLPFGANTDKNSLGHTFLPAYYMLGGWPEMIISISRTIGTFCALLWLLPFLRVETRAGSFAFFGSHVYLSYFPYFPFPWYVPSTMLLALLTLGSLGAQGAAAASLWQKWNPASQRPRHLLACLIFAAVGLVGLGGWLLGHSAREFSAQQKYIEDGNRRKIGEWLRANSQPGDTVFMEPLGYIGYFSGLKTYDFPGMSSREMVKARQEVGVDWADLIQYLRPRWLVLRPPEIARLNARDQNILQGYYLAAQEFNVHDQVQALDVRGREYLAYDARFTVFRYIRPMGFRAETTELTSIFPVSRQSVEGTSVTLVHAPGLMAVKVPHQAVSLALSYGFPPDAYAPGDPTDGARFQIEWQNGAETVVLLDRLLDPANNTADQGLQQFRVRLPEIKAGEPLITFRTLPGGTNHKDWTCWSAPEFH